MDGGGDLARHQKLARRNSEIRRLPLTILLLTIAREDLDASNTHLGLHCLPTQSKPFFKINQAR